MASKIMSNSLFDAYEQGASTARKNKLFDLQIEQEQAQTGKLKAETANLNKIKGNTVNLAEEEKALKYTKDRAAFVVDEPSYQRFIQDLRGKKIDEGWPEYYADAKDTIDAATGRTVKPEKPERPVKDRMVPVQEGGKVVYRPESTIEGKSPPSPQPRSGISLRTAAGDVLSIGGDGKQQEIMKPLDKVNARELEKDLISNQGSIEKIDKIRKEYETNKNLLTFKGDAQNFIDKKQAYLFPESIGKEAKQRLGSNAKFKNLINTEFNAYRREITGAAAALLELAKLKDAMFNEDQDRFSFDASLDNYLSELKRAQRLKRRILREGLSLGTPEGQKRHDALWLSRDDDDINARAAELIQSGKTEEQAFKQMEMEGY